MALTMTQFDRIPSISALVGTSGHRDVIDYINKEMGATSYFGTMNDPFATQHQFFVDNVVAPIQLVAQQFKQQFKELLTPKENRWKPIVSLEDLETGIPECMWEAVALHPTVRKLAEEHRVDLFGMDADKLPKENVYQRLLDNGTATITPESLKESGGTYDLEWDLRSTDPDLSFKELEDLQDTYDFFTMYYSELDRIYDKLGKSDILQKKTYLHDGLQLRDLDITAFPNRKG